MAIKLPNSGIKKSSTSAPKAPVPRPRKSARLRGFSAFWAGSAARPIARPNLGHFCANQGQSWRLPAPALRWGSPSTSAPWHG